MPKKLSGREARQGRRGFPILMVLLFGLLLAAVVWGAVEIYGYAIAPTDVDPQ